MEFKFILEDDDLMGILEIMERAALRGDMQAEDFMERGFFYLAVEGIVCGSSIMYEFEAPFRDILYHGDGVESYALAKFHDYIVNNAEIEDIYVELDRR